MFFNINNREEAIKTIKSVSYGFITIAIIQFLYLGILFKIAREQITNQIIAATIIEYIIYLILGIIFLKTKSKISIIILFSIASLRLITAIIKFLQFSNLSLTKYLLMPIVAFIFGIIGIKAVNVYNQSKK